MGAFLDATFGNLVELVLLCIALKQGEIRVVQASVMGNIISNLLLVLGSSFLAGGLKYHIQEFNKEAAQTNVGLITLACSSLIVPAAFSVSIPATQDYEIINLSHSTAIVLLIVYGLYLLCQVRTI